MTAADDLDKEPSAVGEGALVVRAALLAAWMGALLWLSLMSAPPRVTGVLGWDKLQHALAHAVLTVLAGRFFCLLWRSWRAGWWSGLLLAFAFGVGVELAQGQLTSNRVADWHDLAANLVGSASVLLLVSLRRYRATRRSDRT